MKVGDLVNYIGEPFNGPSRCGLVVEMRDLTDIYSTSRPLPLTSHCKVYWPTHDLTNWAQTKLLVGLSENTE